jgi:hypothetical protein
MAPPRLSEAESIDLSIKRMLGGAVSGLGGTERVGQMLAELLNDPETDRRDRMNGLMTILKLTGQFGEEGEENPAADKQLAAYAQRLASLNSEAAAAGIAERDE